ncbi:hypothetical protein AAHA92_06314 [Salvia divinorum]|uniref:Uncharacterized protein n=1 Tax=Salvia divinorum TaxID=28513 RepID=A0ABD1I592_SALDI
MALRVFVAHFETLWRDLNGFHEMKYGVIRKLVLQMPESWKEWREEAACRFTWHDPQENAMSGDLPGFLKVLYCSLVDCLEELPPSANDEEDEVEIEDKQMIKPTPVVGNEDEERIGMVPGIEDDYGMDDDDDLN